MSQEARAGRGSATRRQRGPEAAVQAACVRVLEREIGAIVIRTNSGQWQVGGHYIQGAARGTSDLTICLPNGVFCALEVKQPGKTPTAEQLAYLARVSACGGLALWVDAPEQIRPILIARFDAATVAAWEVAAQAAQAQERAQRQQQRLRVEKRASPSPRRAAVPRDVSHADALFPE